VQIFQPGVAQLRIKGHVGPNQWAVVQHFSNGSTAPWTQGGINALASTGRSAWITRLMPRTTSNFLLGDTEAVDLTDTGDRSAIQTGAQSPGTLAGSPMAIGTSVMINLNIARRYKGGHPRVYLPPMSTTQGADGDTWEGAGLDATRLAYDNWVSDVLAALATAGVSGALHVVPRYLYAYSYDATRHKVIKTRTGPNGAPQVISTLASSQIRTQRRRYGR
jgi:hypothetical protein